MPRYDLIPGPDQYTKAEVDQLITDAIRRHNRTASMVSAALGILVLAAFCDGLFRALGLIPPFMDIDVSIIDDILKQV